MLQHLRAGLELATDGWVVGPPSIGLRTFVAGPSFVLRGSLHDRIPDSSPLVRVELKRADAAELVKRDRVLGGCDLVMALGPRAGELLTKGVVRRYLDRAVVFQAGEEGTSLMLVLAGEVRLLARRDLDSVELGVGGKGEVLGEVEVLCGSPTRSASAVAHGEADLVELPRDVLLPHGVLPPLLRGALDRVRDRRQRTLDEMTDFLNRW